jgi:hypothetical protein
MRARWRYAQIPLKGVQMHLKQATVTKARCQKPHTRTNGTLSTVDDGVNVGEIRLRVAANVTSRFHFPYVVKLQRSLPNAEKVLRDVSMTITGERRRS